MEGRLPVLQARGTGSRHKGLGLPGGAPGSGQKGLGMPGGVPGSGHKGLGMPGGVPGSGHKGLGMPGGVPGSGHKGLGMPGGVPGSGQRRAPPAPLSPTHPVPPSPPLTSSGTSTFAPALIKHLATSAWSPNAAALCRAVHPSCMCVNMHSVRVCACV